MKEKKELITVQQFADLHGVHNSAVYKRVRTTFENPETGEVVESKGDIFVTLDENGKWMIDPKTNKDVTFDKKMNRRPVTRKPL